MSCEQKQPGLSYEERQHHHALIRFLAARLVLRNRARREAKEQGEQPTLRATATAARRAHEHQHGEPRPALPSKPADGETVSNLLDTRRGRRKRG